MTCASLASLYCDQQSDGCCGFAGLYFAAGVFLDLFLLGATTFAGINYSTNAEAFQKAVKQVRGTLLLSIITALHRQQRNAMLRMMTVLPCHSAPEKKRKMLQ